MSDQVLSASEAERLLAAHLTYPEVGLSRGSAPPTRYRQLRRSVLIGTGEQRFGDATEILLGWNMHRRAGVSVRSSPATVVDGAVAVLGLGWAPFSVKAPVRVVYVVDEDHRKGFAYGTLPGHPESGEERFELELADDGQVTFTITAFSLPATTLARVGGPVSRGVQQWVTNRYLRAV